jgi:uncharacterized protein YjiS (DUF1127 family)
METRQLVAMLIACVLALAILRFVAYHRRRRARREYRRLLQHALDDGMVSQEELEQLESVRLRGELTPAEVRTAALAIYRGALRDAAADARLTPDEDATLQRLLDQLGLTEQDLGADRPPLTRLRMLARVAEGNMPEVPAPVSLVPDERCHWVVQCTLADRIPVPSGARKQLAGAVFVVLESEPFAASGARDALRPADDILPTDIGTLIITSRRTIFQGAKRTISVPHARAETITLYRDGVRVEEIGQSARRYFLVEDPELACAILLQAARRRRSDIRPVRPNRSA